MWGSDGEVDDAFVLVADDEVVDEVGVEDGLEDAGHEGNHDDFLPLVDPVEDVEEAVEAQEEHDVRGDVLDVLALRDHVQLRQNGHRLQPDRERPEDAVHREGLVEEEGQDGGPEVERPVREGVGVGVVALRGRRSTIL